MSKDEAPLEHWPRPWELASDARRDGVRAILRIGPRLVMAFVLLALLNVIYHDLRVIFWTQETATARALAEFCLFVAFVFEGAVLLATSGAVQRSILLTGTKDSTGVRKIGKRPRFPAQYACVLLLWLLAEFILLPLLPAPAAWIVRLVLAVLAIRFSLLVPSAAISTTQLDWRASAFDSWKATGGRVFYLLTAFIVTLVPFFVFVVVPYMLVTLVLNWVRPDLIATALPWLRSIVEPLFGLAMTIFLSAVLSHVFRLALPSKGTA
jgi:hypothetical protein